MAELLVVRSNVARVVKKSKMNMGGDFADALSRRVEMKITRAVDRAKKNGRKTLRGYDL